jgi:putative heme-binding domain-containing protein
LLLANWQGHGPALRSQILGALLSRPEWTTALVTALEKGELAPADFDAATRQRLLATKDAGLKARAEKLLASSSSDRRQVLESYAAALKLEGDAAAGKAVFKERCATCHKLDAVGHEIGPNLASLTNKTHTALLEAILDPSRAVESKYLNYIAITDNGLSLSGVLAEETGSSVTLLAPEGKRQVILRRELEELRSTGKSMMPDGLEKDISPQAMAHLLRYLIGK